MTTKTTKPSPAQPWTNSTPHDRWLDIITRALISLGKAADLAALYAIIGKHPRTQGRKKASWQGKVRQQLEVHPEVFVRVGNGQWSFASLHTSQQVQEFNRLRRERHPLRGERSKPSA